jgi:L-alanine-DL-glutamate epimerase-like enolase superfamily enzyme
VIRGKGMRLAVDGNRSINTRDALRISRELPDIPFILEQPCNTIEELRRIRTQVRHAIYMDENSPISAPSSRPPAQGWLMALE